MSKMMLLDHSTARVCTVTPISQLSFKQSQSELRVQPVSHHRTHSLASSHLYIKPEAEIHRYTLRQRIRRRYKEQSISSEIFSFIVSAKRTSWLTYYYNIPTLASWISYRQTRAEGPTALLAAGRTAWILYFCQK